MEITQIILAIIIALIFILFVIWQIVKNGLRQSIIDMIVLAEETLENNQEKFNTVVGGVIAKLPLPFNLIITTSAVEKLVQKVFDEIKIALDCKGLECKGKDDSQ